MAFDAGLAHELVIERILQKLDLVVVTDALRVTMLHHHVLLLLVKLEVVWRWRYHGRRVVVAGAARVIIAAAWHSLANVAKLHHLCGVERGLTLRQRLIFRQILMILLPTHLLLLLQHLKLLWVLLSLM